MPIPNRRCQLDVHPKQGSACGKVNDLCPLRFITLQKGGIISGENTERSTSSIPTTLRRNLRQKIWQCARVVQRSLMDTGGNKHPCTARPCAEKEGFLKQAPGLMLEYPFSQGNSGKRLSSISVCLIYLLIFTHAIFPVCGGRSFQTPSSMTS